MKMKNTVVLLSLLQGIDGFTAYTTNHVQLSKLSTLYSTPTSQKSQDKLTNDDGDDIDIDMILKKQEIEQMRLEAMERIQSLSTKLKDLDIKASPKVSPTPKVIKEVKVDEGGISTELLEKRMKKESSPAVHPSHKDDLELLDNTQWKISLNIGREPGTWMPKTWGISGERLLINLEVCFTTQQLHEREDFLAGIAGSKVCHVIDQQCTVGPTLSEGSRTFKVSDGGYKICKNDGPLGTDLLRFYIDVQEIIQHKESDVYCPKGRVYCTCGFFPENKGTIANTKLHIRRDLQDVELEILNLQQSIDKESNWLTKMSLMKQMFQLTNFKKTDLQRKLMAAQVTEPDTALLRFSRKKDVALTKEGGICCKVFKEAGRFEYHILGKFGVGAVQREESR